MIEQTILVVDDTQDNLRILVDLLGKKYKIKPAQSGKMALKSALKNPPDLILLDIIMPEMDGYEVCNALKADPLTQDIPIIFLTAKTEMEDIVKGFNIGAVDYITKPFNPIELLARVNTHLTLQQKKIQLAETEKIAAMTRTFEKFVPKQFLNRIAQQGLEHIELGKAEIDQISILFCDIRSFTDLSEQLSPQELLDFLNDYLKRMSTSIEEHSGFVDKFIGDAIMALFDNSSGLDESQAEGAVRAAIGMQKSVQIYNEERQKMGYPSVAVGIGIHSGPVIIGTVGTETRMDSTVLGDSVNLASRIESLTPHYGANILISDSTLGMLSDPMLFKHREIDWVRVKGKTKPVGIYEIIESDLPEIQKLKQQSEVLIVQGLAYRKQQNWEKALAEFQNALEIHPNDKVAQLHIQHCHEFQKMKLPHDWDGAFDWEQK